MNKCIKYLFFFSFLLTVLIFCYAVKLKKTNTYLKSILITKDNQIKSLQQSFEEKSLTSQTVLSSLFRVYKTYDIDGEVKLIRLGKATGDGGYVVPEQAIKMSFALFGYGVSDDISFEEDFSDKFNKPAFGFDCSITDIAIKNKLVKFVPECIGTSDYSDHKISTKTSSFKQQIHKLNLVNKKIFVKMDVEGAEYEVFSELVENANNITGIVMELHLNSWTNNFEKAIMMLSAVNQHFYLVNVHGNNCSEETFEAKNTEGRISRLLQLTYINKNLVTNAEAQKVLIHPSEYDIPNCNDKLEHEFRITY